MPVSSEVATLVGIYLKRECRACYDAPPWPKCNCLPGASVVNVAGTRGFLETRLKNPAFVRNANLPIGTGRAKVPEKARRKGGSPRRSASPSCDSYPAGWRMRKTRSPSGSVEDGQHRPAG